MPKLKIPEHWKGGYDLSNVIEINAILDFARRRKEQPWLTWQTYQWSVEDEFNFFEDWEIIEEQEVSTR